MYDRKKLMEESFAAVSILITFQLSVYPYTNAPYISEYLKGIPCV